MDTSASRLTPARSHLTPYAHSLVIPYYLKMLLKLWVLALSSLALAKSTVSPHEQLKAMAAASPDGVIKLDENSWDLLTSPKREWSAVVQLTALGNTFKCAPCRYVSILEEMGVR